MYARITGHCGPFRHALVGRSQGGGGARNRYLAGVVAAMSLVGVVACGSAPADSGRQAGAPRSAPPVTSAAPSAMSATPSKQGVAAPTPSGAVDPLRVQAPMPAAIPRSGTGRTTVLTPPASDSGPTSPGRIVRYTLEVEGGLGIPSDHFATLAQRILTDERGWQTQDGVRFVSVSGPQRRAGASADVRIILGSPAYVDRGCLPLRTMGQLSCHAGDRVLLNAVRWAQGAPTYGSDVADYRIYLVSHEVGHSLGHGHRSCPAPGQNAPVMVQQTKSLYGCRPWPWPVYSATGSPTGGPTPARASTTESERDEDRGGRDVTAAATR